MPGEGWKGKGGKKGKTGGGNAGGVKPGIGGTFISGGDGGRNGLGGSPKAGCGDGRNGNGGAGKKKSGWVTFSGDCKGSFETLVDFNSTFMLPIGGNFGSVGSGGRGGSFGRGGSIGRKGRGGKYLWEFVGSSPGDGKFGKRDLDSLGLNSRELEILGFWLHKFGCFNGLKVKNPAEKMWVPSFFDLRWSDDEVAVEATAQYGSLLLTNFTVHCLILSTCLFTEKGRWTLNSPRSLVFATLWNLEFGCLFSPHSTSTEAPEQWGHGRKQLFQPTILYY